MTSLGCSQVDLPVIEQVVNGVLYVTINREHKRNALNLETITAIGQSFERAAPDDGLHAAVLTGAGETCFAAGGDLREFDLLRTSADAARIFDTAVAALDKVRQFPLPVVAALNGTALGGGAELAIACDYRIAGPHIKLGFMQGALAITTGFGGGADLFDLTGVSHAMRILCEAKLMDPTDAVAAGLIDVVAPSADQLSKTVETFVESFRVRPTHLLRAIKQIAVERDKWRRKVYREAERSGFIATWTNPEHWRAAEKVLARTR